MGTELVRTAEAVAELRDEEATAASSVTSPSSDGSVCWEYTGRKGCETCAGCGGGGGGSVGRRDDD
jgi:hypothetical protein